MSTKKDKSYRRITQKKMDASGRSIIYQYIDNLCNEPLRVRLHFLWFIIRKINPHTKKKVK